MTKDAKTSTKTMVARLKLSKFLKNNKWPNVLMFLVPFVILGIVAVLARNDNCPARVDSGMSLNHWLLMYTVVMTVGIVASTFSWVVGYLLFWFNIGWMIYGLVLLGRTKHGECSDRAFIASVIAVFIGLLYIGPYLSGGAVPIGLFLR